MPERIRIQREYHVRAPEKSFFFEKDLKRHLLPLSSRPNLLSSPQAQ